MNTKLRLKNQTLAITGPKNELMIAEQEKAIAREQFEMCRQRLMKTTCKVQQLKAAVYFAKKEGSHV